MSEVNIRTGCKINLYLQVTGRRSDGYHTLSTLFLPVSGLFDTITCDFDSAPGIEMISLNPAVPSGKDNLISRAAASYAERTGVSPSWRFVLDKKIPVAAGLGGGSSNAAGVLRVLNEKYGLLSQAELSALAAKLGADVPFFLDPVPAWAEGIGDELVPLERDHVPLHIVLVNPGFPVGVRWSYGKLDPQSFTSADQEAKAALTEAFVSGDVPAIAKSCRNDLGDALWKKFPLLYILRGAMLSAGAEAVQVSGSGPTIFAVCRSLELQRKVADAVRTDFGIHSGLRVFECVV